MSHYNQVSVLDMVVSKGTLVSMNHTQYPQMKGTLNQNKLNWKGSARYRYITSSIMKCRRKY